MAGRQHLFAGSTVALLVATAAAVAFGDACSPSASAADAGDDAGVCNPDSGDPSYCSCDPSKYQTTDCYSGPPGTQAFGICQTGKRSCGKDGRLTPCVGEVTPRREVCNLADDDCNGLIDDVPEIVEAGAIAQCTSPACIGQYADAAIYCWGPDPGICGAGVKACAPSPAGGTPTGCNEYIKTGVYEVCNGIDDDCNGLVDDGLSNQGPCDVPDGATWGDASPFPDGGPQLILGECAHGETTCVNANNTCAPAAPTAETCNGKDDNCDGVIDEHTCSDPTYSWCCSHGGFGYCDTASYGQANSDGGQYDWCRPAYP